MNPSLAIPTHSNRPGIGLYTLAKREILRFVIVAHQTLFPPLVSAFLFLSIFGLSVGKNLRMTGLEIPYLTYIAPGLVTMYLISGSFENTSSSLFISRWHNHIQEVLLSPLSFGEMVIGLLIGGLCRGFVVGAGVLLLAACFEPITVLHPFWLLYFAFTISVIFSSCGMIAALWAKDFGMLSIWGTYVITPAVFLGGVFNPLEMLPDALQRVAGLNPMVYLVSGMRYAVLGISETPLALSAGIALGFALLAFCGTVHLFRIGYRLRT